jgi:hypothetical protein
VTTTADIYRLGAPPGASTAALGRDVRVLVWPRDAVLITSGSTDGGAMHVRHAMHVRAMRELAALSFDPGSLDRTLEDEINRNAWGIDGT